MSTLVVSLATGLVARILVTGETATINAAGVTIRANGAALEIIPATVVLDPAIVTATLPEGVPINRLRWVADGQGGELVVLDPPPPPPRVVPDDISRAQLCMGLFATGKLTASDAEGYAAGNIIPARFEAVVETLPVEQQPFARILLAGLRVAQRDHFLTEALRIEDGLTVAEMDALWQQWGAL